MNSVVEDADGRKDPARMRDFVAGAKAGLQPGGRAPKGLSGRGDSRMAHAPWSVESPKAM